MSNKKLIGYLAMFWVMGVLIALFAPLDVLTGNKLFGRVCDFAFLLLSACGVILVRSSFSEVAAVYFFVIWFTFPFWVLIFWRWMLRQVGGRGGGVIFKENLSAINKIALLCISPIWIFLLYAVVFLYDGGDSRLFKLGSSRVELGLFGMVVPASSAALSSLFVFTLKRVFKKGG